MKNLEKMLLNDNEIPDKEVKVGETYTYREKGSVAKVTVLAKQDDDEYFRVKLLAKEYFNIHNEPLVLNPFYYSYARNLNIAISRSNFYPPEHYLDEIEKCKKFIY